jgi:hypothetical protein
MILWLYYFTYYRCNFISNSTIIEKYSMIVLYVVSKEIVPMSKKSEKDKV